MQCPHWTVDSPLNCSFQASPIEESGGGGGGLANWA